MRCRLLQLSPRAHLSTPDGNAKQKKVPVDTHHIIIPPGASLKEVVMMVALFLRPSTSFKSSSLTRLFFSIKGKLKICTIKRVADSQSARLTYLSNEHLTIFISENKRFLSSLLSSLIFSRKTSLTICFSSPRPYSR